MSASPLSGLEILIIEDDFMFRRRLAAALEKAGAEVAVAENVREGRNCLESLHFDLALVDVNLPDGTGVDLLKEERFSPNTVVIIMTADGGVETAVQAMRLGASDYLSKPFDPAELPLVYQRARGARISRRREEFQQQKEASTRNSLFFGDSDNALKQQIERILETDRRLDSHLPPVLIEGETGTGKTTIARYLHASGPRAAKPLLELNCSALPESLAESELFGHEQGAFTDARSARIGLFEAADGGTLFLDEIASLSASIQSKLLKVIEDGRVRRVGGNREVSVDARIIAASNRPLREAISEGDFREDLFHRLDLLRLQLPPLRDRAAEIPGLAAFLLRTLTRKYRRPNLNISPEGERRLLAYPWPGNIRELAHEVERQVILEPGDTLHFSTLDAGPGAEASAAPAGAAWLNPAWSFPESGFSLEEAEQHLIQLALDQSGGNVSQAARLLGISRDTLRYRLSQKGK